MSAKQIASHVATRVIPPSQIRDKASIVNVTPKPVVKPKPSAYTRVRADEVRNQSGAFVGALDVWNRLTRFLILGTSDNTYYATSGQLTKEMAEAVREAMKCNGITTVDRIVEISEEGAAPKNDPALMALALCASEGDNSTKAHAMRSLPRVARTSTHLFNFLTYAQAFRGWGRLLKEGVAYWYTNMPVNSLALQMAKYRQRDGWTHADVLRKAHPKATSVAMNNLFKWCIKGPGPLEKGDEIPEQIIGYELARTASLKDLPALIHKYHLTWEMIPSEALNQPEVLSALLTNMPLEATVRNLPRLSNTGLISDPDHRNLVISRLTNPELIRKARYHPLKALVALKTYGGGQGLRSSNTWTVNKAVAEALEQAFYLGFQAVEPTGKKIVLGIDVSGSMTVGRIAGMPIAPYEVVAAMAMVTARCEPRSEIFGFTATIQNLGITADDTLQRALAKVQKSNFGSTNPSALLDLAEKKGEADAFVIYTDNEVNTGSNTAARMKQYRYGTGKKDAAMVVVGMTVSRFTIADPKDSRMLDVVGFDTAAPTVISEFIKGKI